MSNNAMETLLGAVVLAVAAGFIAYASQISGFATGGDGRYPLRANFLSAEGVGVGTDVRMAGVKIGAVNSLNLNPETYQAEMTLSVRDDILIPEDSEVKIATEGLLGGNFVELSPGGAADMLEPGEEILMTQSAISFLNLMMRFATGAGESADAGGAQ